MEGAEVEFIKVERIVGRETYELEQGIVKFIGTARKALSNGAQFEDVSVILASAMSDLVPAIRGMDKLDDEARANLPATFNAAGFLAADLAEIFMKKPAAE